MNSKIEKKEDGRKSLKDVVSCTKENLMSAVKSAGNITRDFTDLYKEGVKSAKMAYESTKLNKELATKYLAAAKTLKAVDAYLGQLEDRIAKGTEQGVKQINQLLEPTSKNMRLGLALEKHADSYVC